MGQSEAIAPGETVVLLDKFDLANQYLFVKPGSYTLRFRGRDATSRGESAVPPSAAITVAFRPGELPASVQVPGSSKSCRKVGTSV